MLHIEYAEELQILPNTRADEAVLVAERLRADLAVRDTVLEQGTLTVTISSGIAELLPADGTLDALIHRADMALSRRQAVGAQPNRRLRDDGAW